MHTREPWNIDKAEDGSACLYITDSENNVAVARVTNYKMGGSKANARRIVACVNACVGVHDNYLEAVAEEGGAAKFFKERDLFKQQRDELVTALKEISTFPRYRMPADIAKEALAKITD